MAELKFGDVFVYSNWKDARLMYLGYDTKLRIHQTVILIPQPQWSKSSYHPGRLLAIASLTGARKVKTWPET